MRGITTSSRLQPGDIVCHHALKPGHTVATGQFDEPRPIFFNYSSGFRGRLVGSRNHLFSILNLFNANLLATPTAQTWLPLQEPLYFLFGSGPEGPQARRRAFHLHLYPAEAPGLSERFLRTAHGFGNRKESQPASSDWSRQ